MSTPKKAPSRGKPVNVYLKNEDMTAIRSLAAYASSQGYRASDSQVIRAALQIAQPNGRLLKELTNGLKLDGRLKRDAE